MKKLFILLFTVFSLGSQGQIIQKINTYGVEYKRLEVDSFLRIALDSLPSAPDGSLSFVNHAFYMKDTIWKLVVVPGGTSTAWGSIIGDPNAQTDLMALLNGKVPTTRTITANGIPHALSSNVDLGTFLTGADTLWLHNTVVSLQTNTSTLTFNDGLHQAGNNVVALHDEGLWNASKFQGRVVSSATPLNGQVYAWDSVLLVWKPTSVSGIVDLSPYATIARLIDTASAIRADFPAGGGSQSYQQTLDVSRFLNKNNTIWTPSGTKYKIASGDTTSGTPLSTLEVNSTSGSYQVMATVADLTNGASFYLQPTNFGLNVAGLNIQSGFKPDAFGHDIINQYSYTSAGSLAVSHRVVNPSGFAAISGVSATYSNNSSGNSLYNLTIDSVSNHVTIFNMSKDSIWFQDRTMTATLPISNTGHFYVPLSVNGQAADASGNISLGVPTYADESAATTGGLTTGTIYKTSTGELRIKL